MHEIAHTHAHITCEHNIPTENESFAIICIHRGESRFKYRAAPHRENPRVRATRARESASRVYFHPTDIAYMLTMLCACVCVYVSAPPHSPVNPRIPLTTVWMGKKKIAQRIYTLDIDARFKTTRWKTQKLICWTRGVFRFGVEEGRGLC